MLLLKTNFYKLLIKPTNMSSTFMGLLPQKNENVHDLTFCSCQRGCGSVDGLAGAGSSVLQAKDPFMQDTA